MDSILQQLSFNDNYCDIVYDRNIDIISLKQVQSLQNSCVRFKWVLNRRAHCSQYVNQIKWLRMSNRQDLQLV